MAKCPEIASENNLRNIKSYIFLGNMPPDPLVDVLYCAAPASQTIQHMATPIGLATPLVLARGVKLAHV